MLKKILFIIFFYFNIIICYAKSVLLLTDIHFNPFNECMLMTDLLHCRTLENLILSPPDKWSAIFSNEIINNSKEDSNNAFLTQGIKNLVSIAAQNNIEAVFITGDLLNHNFYLYYKLFAPAKYNNQEYFTKFTAKTMLYVLQQIQNKLPNSRIYMTLGNNDSDNGNYNMPSTYMLESVAGYLNQKLSNNTQFINSFKNGGYFSLPLTNKITVIGLNTNMLSAVNSDVIFAKKQLIWLKQELANAANNKKNVILLQHIPYGMDVYKTVSSGKAVSVLNVILQNQYLEVLKTYATVIDNIYAGHYHSQYLSVINKTTALIGNLAFNVNNGNNPGFTIAHIDDAGKLADAIVYYSDLSDGQIKWQILYSLSQIYGSPYKLVTTLNKFPADTSESKVINYRKYFNGNNTKYPQPISLDKNWRFYYCGIKYIQPQEYIECLE